MPCQNDTVKPRGAFTYSELDAEIKVLNAHIPQQLGPESLHMVRVLVSHQPKRGLALQLQVFAPAVCAQLDDHLRVLKVIAPIAVRVTGREGQVRDVERALDLVQHRL
eukprot:34349-Rhodomonas_salina.1